VKIAELLFAGRLPVMLRITLMVFLFLVFDCWTIHGPVFGKDTVHVNISATVKWDTKPQGAADVNSSNLVRWSEGTLNCHITGIMVRDDSKSPVVSKKGQFFRPALRYVPQSMFVTYSYDEWLMQNDHACPIVHEYHGRGGGDVTRDSKLSINLFSSMAERFLQNLSPAQKQLAGQMQKSMMLPDYYEFVVGGFGAKRKLQGKVRVPKSGERCSYRSAEKSIPGFSLGLVMKLPPSGTMEGRRTWFAEAKTEPPSFKMGVCDVGEITRSKPLTPPEGGKKNVTYTVRWHLGEKLTVPPDVVPEIENKEKNCEEMRKKIEWIEKTIEAFEDRHLREEIRKKYGSEGMEAIKGYQEAVQKRVAEHFKDPVTGKPPETASNLETDPHCTSEKCGPGENAPTIDAVINGKSTHLIQYDKEGNFAEGNYPAIEQVITKYENSYGKDAGRNLFNGDLDHEKSHVSDFATKGYPQTIDEFAEYELNGLYKQLDKWQKDLKDMGC